MTLYTPRTNKLHESNDPWDGFGYSAHEKQALTWQAKQLRFKDGMYRRQEQCDDYYRKEAMNMDIRSVVCDFRDSNDRGLEYRERVTTRRKNTGKNAGEKDLS